MEWFGRHWLWKFIKALWSKAVERGHFLHETNLAEWVKNGRFFPEVNIQEVPCFIKGRIE